MLFLFFIDLNRLIIDINLLNIYLFISNLFKKETSRLKSKL